MSSQFDLFGQPLPEEAKPAPTPPPPVPVKGTVSTTDKPHGDIPRRPYTVYKQGKDFTTIWHL